MNAREFRSIPNSIISRFRCAKPDIIRNRAFEYMRRLRHPCNVFRESSDRKRLHRCLGRKNLLSLLVFPDILSVNSNGALRRVVHSRYNLQNARLADASRTNQCGRLAFLHNECLLF